MRPGLRLRSPVHHRNSYLLVLETAAKDVKTASASILVHIPKQQNLANVTWRYQIKIRNAVTQQNACAESSAIG